MSHIQAERCRPAGDPVDKVATLTMCERAATAMGWLMNAQTHATEETVYLLREVRIGIEGQGMVKEDHCPHLLH